MGKARVVSRHTTVGMVLGASPIGQQECALKDPLDSKKLKYGKVR
jgi:hypothetical protein